MNNLKKYTPGLISPVLYGIIPVLVLINLPGISYGATFVNGAVVTFAKDIVGLPLYIIAVYLAGKKTNIWKELRSKAGFWAMVAGLFGGPIGYTLYNTAFYLAGPSYGHIFTSIEPIILVLMVYLFYKRKFNLTVMIGIALSTVAVIVLVAGSSFKSPDSTKILIGSLLGILGALSWSIESFVFEKAIRASSTKDINLLVAIKVVFALLVNTTMFFPIMGAIDGNAAEAYSKIGTIFHHTAWMWRILIGGILLFIARLLYFYAINKIGPTISSVLYLLSVIVTPIMSFIIYAITNEFTGEDSNMLSVRFQIVFWICAVGIVSASALVIYGQQKGVKNENKR